MADLTIGFSTYEDYHGAVFTIEILRSHHRKAMQRCELLIVDQTQPKHPHAVDLRNFLGKIPKEEIKTRYVSMPEPLGTSPGRDVLCRMAETPYVLCIDGHIDVWEGSLEALLGYYDEHPGTKDMLHGLLVGDDHIGYYSHMEVVWRQGMLGIWQMMWSCRECGRPFFVVGGIDEQKRSRALYLKSPTQERWATNLANHHYGQCDCGLVMPPIAYEGHEKMLESFGFQRMADKGQPFQIPAHGLGMFSCAVQTWKDIGGFNNTLRGFGGEECYIHEKIRRNGGKTMCLPDFKWWHRFGRPGGPPYVLAQLDKIRNNIITHQELGWDIQDVKRHFTTQIAAPERNATEEQWLAVLERIDISKYPRHGFSVRREVPQTRRRQMQHVSIDQVFNEFKAKPRDLDQHMETLKKYASMCEHVTELSKRRESTIGLLAGRPIRFVSYNLEANDPTFELLHYIVTEGPEGPGKPPSRIDTFSSTLIDSLSVDPETFEETDLLFIDTFQNADRLREELKRFLPKVKRFLILHDTAAFGEFGDNQKEGLNFALREMVVEHPEWKPIYFTPTQYGMTVLSKLESDYPDPPIVAWKESKGPGSELKKIMLSLDIPPNPNCDCNAKAAQMDAWGVEGCKQNFETIVGWLKDGAPKWGWWDKIQAAKKSVTTGLIKSFNPLDPFPGIIKEAIRRAEEKENFEKGEFPELKVEKVEASATTKLSPNLPKKGAKWIEAPEEAKPKAKQAPKRSKSKKRK